MRKALLVQTRATGQKGYVYHDENNDPNAEKVQVRLIDQKFRETGENVLCSLKNLITIGYKD